MAPNITIFVQQLKVSQAIESNTCLPVIPTPHEHKQSDDRTATWPRTALDLLEDIPQALRGSLGQPQSPVHAAKIQRKKSANAASKETRGSAVYPDPGVKGPA